MVSEDSNEYGRRSFGLLALMQQFSTFLDLSFHVNCVCCDFTLFAMTEELSTAHLARMLLLQLVCV